MGLALAPGSSEITVEEVKLRLNKTLTVDDDEIQSMIFAALAEYVEFVGPLTPAAHVAVVTPALMSDGFYGIYTPRIPLVAVSSITDGYGTAVSPADYIVTDAPTGLVRPAADATISLTTSWPSQMVVSYTYGGMGLNHREFVIAEVAGYFSNTQRGGGAGPSFASEGYEAAYGNNPVQLFPRIALLAERLGPVCA